MNKGIVQGYGTRAWHRGKGHVYGTRAWNKGMGQGQWIRVRNNGTIYKGTGQGLKQEHDIKAGDMGIGQGHEQGYGTWAWLKGMP